MTSSIGTFFINEMPVPIRRIFLRDGKVLFEAVVSGPVILPQQSEVRIHDPEGHEVAVAPWTMAKRDVKAAAGAVGGYVTIELPVSVHIANWPST